jgi:CheY-like chemotaxis protein
MSLADTGLRTTETVLLLGFGPFEQQSLEAYFRMLVHDDPAFELLSCPLTQVRWIVANADDPRAVLQVRAAARMASTVFVGARTPDGAGMLLPRPIDPLAVQRALIALHRATPSPAAPAPAAPRSAVVETRTTAPEVDVLLHAHEVLVVDDSEIARQYLRVQFERLGCRVEVAASLHEARARLAARTYAAVFIDLSLDAGDASELGGLVLCHELNHRVGPRPRIVVVTGRSSGTDRVRASLAGCDSYRVKPVTAASLAEELARIGASAVSRPGPRAADRFGMPPQLA